MQRDFHFEATYYASRLAEFSEDEALKIAWAAQYIDDATDVHTKNLTLPNGQTYSFTNILTANTIPFGSGLTRRDDKHRQIWALFHFPPGNYRAYGSQARTEHILRPYRGVAVPEPGQAYSAENLDNDGPISDLENDKLTREHFPMICRPYSDLVLAMIKDTDTVYKVADKAGWKELALHFLGVRVHVFADTWAHQDHIGAPDRRFNRVESFYWYRGQGQWDDCAFVPASPLEADDPAGSQDFATKSRNSNAWLGHGPMGNWPDLPWAVYQWQPRYNLGQDPFVKNNPEQFLLAFTNLVHAMRCFRGNEQWTPKWTAGHIKEVLGDWLDVFKNCILEMQAATTASTVNGRKERRFVDMDRAQIWIKNFSDLGRPVYDVESANNKLKDLQQGRLRTTYEAAAFMNTAYFGFHYGAKIHYRFMRNELRDQGFRIIFNNLAREEGMVRDFMVLQAALAETNARDPVSRHVDFLVESAMADCTRSTDKDDVQLGIQLLREDLCAEKEIASVIEKVRSVCALEAQEESFYKLYTDKKVKKRVQKLLKDLESYQRTLPPPPQSSVLREDLAFHASPAGSSGAGVGTARN